MISESETHCYVLAWSYSTQHTALESRQSNNLPVNGPQRVGQFSIKSLKGLLQLL